MCPEPIESETNTKRDPRAFNAYRHGLTGQVLIMTPADELAYTKHCRGILASLAVEGDLEKSFGQSIADDRWRLLRCAAIENTRFSMGMNQPDQYFAHHPEIDSALAQAVVWACEADNFNLMSLYENRAQRRLERNMIILKQLQAERKAAFEQAVEEATLLAQYAASKGEPYHVETDFPPEALPPQFAFSLPKIASRVAHNLRLAAAKNHFAAPKQTFRKAA
ncbi:hypothetical protein SBA3_3140003 [Candidatus Sulfopaludibacter sp. SbA3]|nr:hypothetical protein SBA3_3140003 [Candidatus Sulfopaludibacter sp. SbA3]